MSMMISLYQSRRCRSAS